MKKVLFATTATAALAIGGMASAQGIALFGDARLGLGYNINNDGGVVQERVDPGNPDDLSTEFTDDLRAISRVRFGVNMTGETDSGITFGATIRADNSQGGQGGTIGQSAGSVFVSGSWGTLTYGDTNAADEQWVGDVPGDYSVTGLTDIDETRFISNGGSFNSDTGANFFPNPTARPTVRYDFDVAGFGGSLSTNRDLNDIGVGAGYAADFGGGSWNIGLGYYDWKEFSSTLDAGGFRGAIDVPDGHQWSAGVKADYESFAAGVTYTQGEAEDDEFAILLLGGSMGFGAWSVGAVYANVINADGGDDTTGLSALDGDQAGGVTAQYDLGGGATVNFGVMQSYSQPILGADGAVEEWDNTTIGDFGIVMSF
jgi:outer membrane protein OmpU